MKIQIVLFVIFAFAYLSEAAKLRIRVQNYFDEKTPTKGQIYLTLHGKTSERQIIFNSKFTEETEPLETEVEFETDVPTVTAKWQTESNKPIRLDFITINTNLTKNTDFYLMDKIFENGDSYTFKKYDEKDIPDKFRA